MSIKKEKTFPPYQCLYRNIIYTSLVLWQEKMPNININGQTQPYLENEMACRELFKVPKNKNCDSTIKNLAM
jgi:hypothetical protein